MRILAFLLSLCLLTGCSSLLEREYSTVETHSSKFFESEAANTLRAENYQDIVNDLLLLIGQHTEQATLRLYKMEEDLQVAEYLDRAITEVQQETPLGAYAVEYISVSRQAQKSHYEAQVNIGYRRSTEEIQSVVSATSTEALYPLLESSLNEGCTHLAVRVGYWDEDSTAQVEDTVARLREARGLTKTPEWQINYYPANGPVGLIEFLLAPPAEEAENQAAETALDTGAEPAERLRPKTVSEKNKNFAKSC